MAVSAERFTRGECSKEESVPEESLLEESVLEKSLFCKRLVSRAVPKSALLSITVHWNGCGKM